MRRPRPADQNLAKPGAATPPRGSGAPGAARRELARTDTRVRPSTPRVDHRDKTADEHGSTRARRVRRAGVARGTAPPRVASFRVEIRRWNRRARRDASRLGRDG